MMDSLIKPVLELVRAAGQATLPYWQAGVAVQTKADDSPVTAADIAAHKVLTAGLAALDASIPVLSEEEYTVNVALVERGEVVFGVVGVPVTDSVYYGGAAFGAFCRDADGAIRSLQMRTAPQDELVVLASKRHSSPEQEALLQGLAAQFPRLHLLNVGSSLKFCQMAEGAADLYPRLAPTSQWDTAAAQGVLEGAGGQVLNLQGQALTYAAQESYLNPHFIALPQQAPWREQVLASI